MPLTNVQIQPGFNKQVTEVGAEGQWVDGDNVRFRYGLPEKNWWLARGYRKHNYWCC